MKFRYYIIDTRFFTARGTNNSEVAEKESEVECLMVIDAQEGEEVALGTIGERFAIEEAKA